MKFPDVRYPDPLSMLEEFYVEPLLEPDPVSKDWVYEITDSTGITLILSFNYHIHRIRTVLKLGDHELAQISQEGAEYLAIERIKPNKPSISIPFMRGEFSHEDTYGSVEIDVFPHISVTWKMFYRGDESPFSHESYPSLDALNLQPVHGPTWGTDTEIDPWVYEVTDNHNVTLVLSLDDLHHDVQTILNIGDREVMRRYQQHVKHLVIDHTTPNEAGNSYSFLHGKFKTKAYILSIHFHYMGTAVFINRYNLHPKQKIPSTVGDVDGT